MVNDVDTDYSQVIWEKYVDNPNLRYKFNRFRTLLEHNGISPVDAKIIRALKHLKNMGRIEMVGRKWQMTELAINGVVR